MIIILEGADGSGKTSVAKYLHDLLPLSNVIKLSGAPKDVKDKSWMENVYWKAFPFLDELGNKSIVIMDRAWPSEWVYAPLFKDYEMDYIHQLHSGLHSSIDVNYIYLKASPEVLHERIVNEKSVQQPREEHPDWKTIRLVSDRYDRWYEIFSKDFSANYYSIDVDDMYPQDVAKEIIKLLNLDQEKDTTYSRIGEGGVKLNKVVTGLKGADYVDGTDPSKAVRSRGFEHIRPEFREYDVEGFIPQRATKYSAGYDIRTPIDFIIGPNERMNIPTNIKAYMRPNEVLELHVRSSIGIKGNIVLSNGTGIIDMDFYGNPDNDGNITLALWNTGNDYVSFKRGTAICQGIFKEYKTVDNDKPVSDKRIGGIGSTS